MIDVFFLPSDGVCALEVLEVVVLRGALAGLSPAVEGLETLFSLCSWDFPAEVSRRFALEACSVLPSTSWGVIRRRFLAVPDCSPSVLSDCSSSVLSDELGSDSPTLFSRAGLFSERALRLLFERALR